MTTCRHRAAEPVSGRHFKLETFLIEWCPDCGALAVGKSPVEKKWLKPGKSK
jgi:hypothetical protein